MAKKAVNPAPKQEQKSLEEALSKSEQFFENNKKTIFGCLIAIIVIIAGGMIYNAKVAQPRQEKASEAIFPGEAYFMNGDYSTALNGDAYGFEGFVELADQFKGTKANKLANLYAGLCYAQLDSMEIAQKYLAKFNGKDQMVAPAALGALGNYYATAGEYNKAIAAFEKATGIKIPYVIDPRRPGDVAENYANADKAFEELGWKAKLNVEDACRDSYRFQTTTASK